MQKYSEKPETRKAFNYDLYNKKVEKYYTGTSNAWNDIKIKETFRKLYI